MGPLHNVLDKIAAELSGTAETVSRLAEGERRRAVGGGETVPLDAVAETLLRQRHARAKFLPPSLFHEPAWEILLSLFVAQRRGQVVNVKQLVEQVDAPVTTSQRWIDTLAHMKLVHRLVDASDRRRIELSLTEHALSVMERYLRWTQDGERANGACPKRPAPALA